MRDRSTYGPPLASPPFCATISSLFLDLNVIHPVRVGIEVTCLITNELMQFQHFSSSCSLFLLFFFPFFTFLLEPDLYIFFISRIIGVDYDTYFCSCFIMNLFTVGINIIKGNPEALLDHSEKSGLETNAERSNIHVQLH